MTYSAFGERVRNFRIEAGLSQRELAESTGLTRSVIANWESGRRMGAQMYELVPLARVLNVHVAALAPELDTERAQRISEAKAAVGRALRELDDALGRQRG